MEASEKKELTGVCMIDQSAAYDLHSHEIFAEKLKLYNFDEASVTWCMSYLERSLRQVTTWSVKTVGPLKDPYFLDCFM